jgi:hypothetical protein
MLSSYPRVNRDASHSTVPYSSWLERLIIRDGKMFLSLCLPWWLLILMKRHLSNHKLLPWTSQLMIFQTVCCLPFITPEWTVATSSWVLGKGVGASRMGDFAFFSPWPYSGHDDTVLYFMAVHSNNSNIICEGLHLSCWEVLRGFWCTCSRVLFTSTNPSDLRASPPLAEYHDFWTQHLESWYSSISWPKSMEFAREVSQHVVLRYTAISFPLSLSLSVPSTRTFFCPHFHHQFISISSWLSTLSQFLNWRSIMAEFSHYSRDMCNTRRFQCCR